MMGTLVLARVAGNGEFSDEILGAGRDGRAGSRGARKAGSEEIRAPEGRDPVR